MAQGYIPKQTCVLHSPEKNPKKWVESRKRCNKSSLPGLSRWLCLMCRTVDLNLVKEAQSGRQAALSVLSESAREKVYVFVLRMTLDPHLADDLAQETILEMVRSKAKLSFAHVNSFWAWLHRTALGKVQHHYRIQGNKRVQSRTSMSDDRLKQVSGREESGINKLLSDERRKSVFDAMGGLNLAYRSILTLRCFEQMTYPQIAAVTGQTELQARVQFFRAKQSLKKQLKRRGLGREHFLAALSLFGTITAGTTEKASAATIVSQVSMETGGAAVCVGLFVSKAGLVTAAIVLAGLIVGGNLLAGRAGRSTMQPGDALRRAYNTFATPTRLVDASDPDGNGWQAYTTGLTRVAVPSGGLEEIITRRPSAGSSILELPEGHWVHVEFAGPLVDGPGADILVDARRFGRQAQVFVTDGANRMVALKRTGTLTTGGGFAFSGFDLSGRDIPFEPRAVRLVGCGVASRGDCLELWVLKARTNADD